MFTYKGPTVTISGKVDYLGYEAGQRIRIAAKSSPGAGLVDIASVFLLLLAEVVNSRFTKDVSVCIYKIF